MAFIQYIPQDQIGSEHRIDDNDNILQIHGIHPEMMKLHLEMYRELMHKPGVLSRVEREMIGVAVSAINKCHY